MSSSNKGPVKGWKPLSVPNAQSAPTSSDATPADPGDASTGAAATPTPAATPSSDPLASTAPPFSSNPPVITWRARRSRAETAPVIRVTAQIPRRRGNTPVSVPQSTVPRTQQPPLWPYDANPPIKSIKWPQQTVKISAPPASPVKPSQSPVTFWITVTSAIITILVVINTPPDPPELGSRPWTWLLSVALALLTASSGIANFAWDVYDYRRIMEQRKAKYVALQKQWRQKLETLSNQQRDVSQQAYPAPETTITMVNQQSMDLGSRWLDDGDDFLRVRIGIGDAIPVYTIVSELPTQHNDEIDPLVSESQEMIDTFQRVPNCPITLPITSGPTCILGEWELVQAFARALIIQIAAYHEPGDLRIVMVFRESESKEWDWTRWLPHTWNDSRTERFISTNEDATIDMLRGLEDALRQKAGQGELRGDERAPALLFIFANPDLLNSRRAELKKLLDLLKNDGPRLNAYTLFLSESSRPPRRDCTITLTLTDETATLRQTEPQQSEITFIPDQLNVVKMADDFARQLAPLRTPEEAENEQLATSISLLKMLNLQNIEQAQVMNLWQQAEPFKSLMVPIGRNADNQLFSLDIHRSAHGPHGLVVGMPGAGKSNFLQTLVSSLALHYHPSELAFVIFDYKGNSQTRVFTDLPHQTRVVTSLDGNRAMDVLQSLQDELRRRKQVLDNYQMNNIDDYNFLRRRRSYMQPMPYIVIVADEFAQVFLSNYSFVQKLFETANLSDDLGLHLLFATNEINHALIDQLSNMTSFRLCFQVRNAEESLRIIGRPDAEKLIYRGQAYFQAGKNGVFRLLEQVRIAWSDAIYDPQGNTHATPEFFEVATNGIRRPLNSITMPNSMTQAQGIVSYLREAAHDNNIPPQNSIVWAATAGS